MNSHSKLYPYETYEEKGKWGIRINYKFPFFWYDTMGVPINDIKEFYEKFSPNNKNEYAKLWWNCMNGEHPELIKKWMEELNENSDSR